MIFRKLGKTNLETSVIGMGTWQFSGEWGVEFSQPQVDAILETARECKINLLDTAECYGDHISEKFIGRGVKKDRENWIIATKYGHHFNHFMDRDQLWSAKDVMKQLEESLKSLQTDYIDLYQFHSGDNVSFDNDELWTMLDKQKQAGKIRHLGVSLSNTIDGILEYQSSKASDVGVEVLQVLYNRLDRRPEAVVFDQCRKQNLGLLARVPMASGLLSGKYKTGTTFKKSDIRSANSLKDIEAMLEKVEQIREEEVPTGVEMSQWALAWCLKDSVVTSVIPGCKNPAQVRANAKAADLVKM
jgi:aryl-alcohol dehydrogenase-like predicted oxidoreductase